MTLINSSTTIPFSDHYYHFKSIKRILDQISIPYLLLVGFIGLITNTSTIVLLSRHFITKNLKNKWTLIALGTLIVVIEPKEHVYAKVAYLIKKKRLY